jgi:hypothetical protein
MRYLAVSWAFAIASLTLTAAADSVKYVSSDELQGEIERRTADIARTRLRLAELAEQAVRAEQERRLARESGRAAEARAARQAGVLYRISRQGGALRYLLQATDAMDLMARLTMLKRLLYESLDARRAAGLRIAAAEKRVSQLSQEKLAAAKMLEMLEAALAELRDEQARALGEAAPAAPDFSFD